MPRFSSALLTRRCVRNWLQVGLAVARVQKHYALHLDDPTDMHFRDGNDLKAIPASLVWALLVYYDYAKRLEIFCRGDLNRLAYVTGDIMDNLRHEFSPDAVATGETGAACDAKFAWLFLMVRKWSPAIVVETGVGQGVSSYAILEALQMNGKGRLISLDIPNRNPNGYTNVDGRHVRGSTPSAREPGWLVPREYHRIWDLRIGKSSAVLPKIAERVDIFYHDSEHTYRNMTFEYNWAHQHLKNGGILASDDVNWNEAFSEFKRKHGDLRELRAVFDPRIHPAFRVLIKTHT